MVNRKVMIEGFNEADFIDSFKSSHTDAPSTVTSAESKAEHVISKENKTDKDIPKKEANSKKSKKDDYLTIFFEPKDDITPRYGKTITIRPEYHTTIQQLVRIVANEEITIFNYLDNVIEHHLKQYSDEISKIYSSKLPIYLKSKQ